jgi:hypothetical protein
MRRKTSQFALLLIGFTLLALSLVACQSNNGSNDNSAGNVLSGFKTPNTALFTATPNFPPFTIGAWPSNYSPQNNDTVTIYVLCRVQPSDMSSPPAAPNPPVSVHVSIADPFTKTADGTTDASGLAAIPISFSDPQSGYPVRVYVSASWKGITYSAETDFTPNVTQPPPATPSTTATP